MCFPISKIPQSRAIDINGVLVENPQYEEQKRYLKEIEKATRNPLSVGKERHRGV